MSKLSPFPDHAHLPDLLRESVEQFGISTETTNVDMLLAGEASRHFPEPRNRRRKDVEDAEIRRLRTILDALDKGAGYPGEAEEHMTAPVHSQFYRQF